ncbi:MAG: septation ring formation regulator EzrA [Alicyclobacillaceae bacterium]|nr:septation ring formation regulator EzrA [Alicyclobacillaceae bacterium]
MRDIDKKLPVSVKGTKHGLLFLLDDQCDFDHLLACLGDLLHGETATVFTGPPVDVFIDYGCRELSPDQARDLLNLFLQKDNFVLREWGGRLTLRRSGGTALGLATRPQSIHKGTVRAGQRLVFEGDVVVVGDVNPGGEIVASGDIFVLGRLSGVAHAGASGDVSSVIGAAEFSPMQLRIAGTVRRAPEVDGRAMETFMEFAYLRDGGMAVDRMEYLPYIRRSVR